jgi:hypothetical protein
LFKLTFRYAIVTQPIIEGFMNKAKADTDLKQIVVVRPSFSRLLLHVPPISKLGPFSYRLASASLYFSVVETLSSAFLFCGSLA